MAADREPTESGARARMRSEITDVLIRYATGIDRRNWELFRSCFTADCECDYGAIGTWRDVEGITEYMTTVHEDCRHTLHRITNVSVDLASELTASARSYVDAIILGPEGRGGVRATGFYDDELVRADDGWRIARRQFTMVHAEPVGEGMKL
jgi:3-phenylpropionate/cinnamic acid dioxygenase small subunit